MAFEDYLFRATESTPEGHRGPSFFCPEPTCNKTGCPMGRHLKRAWDVEVSPFASATPCLTGAISRLVPAYPGALHVLQRAGCVDCSTKERSSPCSWNRGA